MDSLLKSINKGTKELLGESGEATAAKKSSSSKVLTNEQRRNAATSSWAKSTTKKEYPIAKKSEGSTQDIDNIGYDVLRSEKFVKMRTPEYSFGIRPTYDGKSKAEEYFSGDYDINVDMLSTKKRSRTSMMSTTARPCSTGY